jgi:hypothetical protein
MKTARLLTTSLLALPALVHAHPGHDGHELTWDFHVLIATAGTWLYLRKRSRE